MAKHNQIPEGYVQDAHGRLVPVDLVKDVDKLRDQVLLELINEAVKINETLREFKARSFDNFLAFVDLSAEKYGKKHGGKKGNVGLTTFDGNYKVQLTIKEHQVFDERLAIAKDLIDDCINEWAKDSSSEIRMLINDAFQVDKQGNVDVKRILSLRKFKIDSPRWKQAMEAIADSISANGSKAYLLFYERDSETNAMRQIPLSFPKV